MRRVRSESRLWPGDGRSAPRRTRGRYATLAIVGKAEPRTGALDGAGVDGVLLPFLRVLASSSDGTEVGLAVADGLLREFAPTQVSAYFLDASGDWLDEQVTHARPPGLDDISRLPLSIRVPMTEVMRTGESAAWKMADAAAVFPAVAGWVHAQPERADEQALLMPIRAEGRLVGVLVVCVPGPVERTWRLRVLLEAGAIGLGLWWRAAGAEPDRDRSRGGRSRGVVVTERQLRILDGVRRERSNRQIADELMVSLGTVKADLAILFRNFGVSDRRAVAALVPDALNGQERPAAPVAVE